MFRKNPKKIDPITKLNAGCNLSLALRNNIIAMDNIR